MIRIVFYNADAGLTGFRAHGHAGYAESGSDIVCAAVSGILETACEGITSVLHIDAQVQQNDESGFLSCQLPPSLPDASRHDAGIMLAAAQAGLRAIQRQYPDHVRLISRKWRPSHDDEFTAFRP